MISATIPRPPPPKAMGTPPNPPPPDPRRSLTSDVSRSARLLYSMSPFRTGSRSRPPVPWIFAGTADPLTYPESPVITATDLELRAGARVLLEPTTLRVQRGDRIGLVGRNGAGKTTTLRVFAGESLPHAGRIDRTGPVGYLPQDPRTGDLAITARDRVLSARGLDTLVGDIAKAQVE